MFRRILPLLCFSLIYVANTSHNWFSDDPKKLYNLIVFDYKPMTAAWNAAYISQQVIIPLLMTCGVDLILKTAVLEKIYKIEWKIFKTFIVLNSIAYFLIFRNGDHYSWIYWLLCLTGTFLWCKKNNCDKP